MGIVLSLCDYSGAWSEPYARAGYNVVRVDMQFPFTSSITPNVKQIRADVRTFSPEDQPDIVLAAPPCTCFCRPGARWWKRQDESGQTADDVMTFLACLKLCRTARRYWALENPPGRHATVMPYIPRPAWQFQPYEFGDPWRKQTYIWGTAAKPAATNIATPPPTRRTPNGRTQGRIAFMSSSWQNQRSETPRGFAEAFFAANEAVYVQRELL